MYVCDSMGGLDLYELDSLKQSMPMPDAREQPHINFKR